VVSVEHASERPAVRDALKLGNGQSDAANAALPLLIPWSVAIGAASTVQVIASAVLCVIATVLSARTAGIVYRRSVMRTGGRVRWRQVLRAETG
jgi:hypothetical protein